jgi:RHS repeat-associated protein
MAFLKFSVALVFGTCTAYTLAQTLPTVPIYSYSVPSGGYASNGNLLNYTDLVTGTWNLGYDNLNRLTSGTVTPAVNQNQYFCWSYDSFGNRTVQAASNQPFQTDSPTCQPASSATISNNIASYNNANRISSTNANGVVIAPGYDAAGNLTDDGINQVLYDAENRVCAVFNRNTSAITQYIYDAEGRRVAKGHPANGNALYCPTGPGDFIPDETYVVGQNGEQVSELDSTGHWIHSNVYAGGQLLATYSQNGSSQLLHFNVTDHLGSKRVQTTAGGAVELTCLNLPFGDGLTCTGAGTDATEHHFTGKERDQESGLDYFDARYYGSTMGRFMSPDPGWYLQADVRIPQSWNQYIYVLNNPLKNTDPTGMYCDYSDHNDPASAADESQQDYHSSESECTATDENGNRGVWVNDAATHQDSTGQWVDNDGRPDSAISTNTTAAPMQNGTFTSNMSMTGFISMMQQSNFYLSDMDQVLADRHWSAHSGIQMRQDKEGCNLHVNIDRNSGKNGNPVTGDFHYDVLNPNPNSYPTDSLITAPLHAAEAAVDIGMTKAGVSGTVGDRACPSH